MNRRSLLVAVSAASALLVAGTPALAQNRAPVGKVEKVQAQVVAAFQNQTRRLATADPIIFRDTLQSGPKARLKAKMADDTELTLGENGEIVVDEFVYDPKRNRGNKMALTVKSGAFLFVGGKTGAKHGGSVSINTPIGTLGVRGTTVWGGPIDGGYGIFVLDGEVEVQTANGSVVVTKGVATMVNDGVAPTTPAAWPDEKVARAVATISFDPETPAPPAEAPAPEAPSDPALKPRL